MRRINTTYIYVYCVHLYSNTIHFFILGQVVHQFIPLIKTLIKSLGAVLKLRFQLGEGVTSKTAVGNRGGGQWQYVTKLDNI